MMQKNIVKRAIQIVFMFAIVFVGISVNMIANADGETTTIQINFDSTNAQIILDKRDNNGNDELVGVVGEDQHGIGMETTSNSNTNLKSISITCQDANHCTASVVVTSGTGVRVITSGDSPFEIHGNVDNITADTNLEIVDREVQQPFDGKAYLIWECDGKTCMKFIDFNSFTPMETIEGTYYINANNITDQIGGVKKFDIDAPLKGWATTQTLEDWEKAYRIYKGMEPNAVIDYSQVDPEILIGNPIDMREWEDKAVEAGACNPHVSEDEFHSCVDEYVAQNNVMNTRAQLRPVGEPQSNNSYVSYGDRQFKAIVYNNSFRSLSIGSLADLNYYPMAWADGMTRLIRYF